MSNVEHFLQVEQTKAEHPVANAVAFILYVIGTGLIACLIPVCLVVWRWGL